MPSVNLSNLVFTKAKFRYSISEIVDDFLKKKLDKEVREYAKILVYCVCFMAHIRCGRCGEFRFDKKINLCANCGYRITRFGS